MFGGRDVNDTAIMGGRYWFVYCHSSESMRAVGYISSQFDSLQKERTYCAPCVCCTRSWLAIEPRLVAATRGGDMMSDAYLYGGGRGSSCKYGVLVHE